MLKLIKTQIGRLRLLAFAEGTSLLLIFFVTMPLKYGLNIHEPNLVVGMAHGILFILYVLAVLQIAIGQRWSFKETGLSLLASIIPFGTFIADSHIFKKK